MTSKFDQKEQSEAVVSLVNDTLNEANQRLSADKVQDIAAVRQAALNAARTQQNNRGRASQSSLFAILDAFLSNRLAIAAPAAVAVVVMVLVSYQPQPSIEAIPADMMTADIPSEDLSLLEDLEFASWLEQQSGEATN